MSWEVGNYYRARGVAGEFAIKQTPNGKKCVEGLVEITVGPQTGQRIRYKGWLTTDTSREQTAAELRVMGCKLTRWGDFTGIGSREVQFRLMADEASDGSGKLYYRAAFVSAVTTLDRTRGMVKPEEIDALPPPPPAPNGAASNVGAAAPPTPPAAGEGDVQEEQIPF